MKKRETEVYTKVISDVMDNTEKNGTDLNGDFDVMRKAIDGNKVTELSADNLNKIQKHFQTGTDKYQENVNQLQTVSVPVKLLGRHSQLVRAYKDYADGCQKMTDSVNPVNVEQFNQAEKDQEAAINRVSSDVTRILSTLR